MLHLNTYALLLCTDFVDSRKALQDNSSLESAEIREPKTQPRGHNTPFEANVIQSSLLSAAVPLVSASVASPQGEFPSARHESLSGDESGVYSEDALPVSFKYKLLCDLIYISEIFYFLIFFIL